jgi:hypothetical protein
MGRLMIYVSTAGSGRAIMPRGAEPSGYTDLVLISK